MSNQPNKTPGVYTEMQLAMLAGMLNCSLNGSAVWQKIPCLGESPTPEELIVWAAQETVRRMTK